MHCQETEDIIYVKTLESYQKTEKQIINRSSDDSRQDITMATYEQYTMTINIQVLYFSAM